MSLCWMCRESINAWMGFKIDFSKRQDIHCHHEEPEDKPQKKCWWCEDWNYINMGLMAIDIKRISELIGLSETDPECPICRRKLNG